MAIFKGLEKLVEIESKVIVIQSSQKLLSFYAGHILVDKTRCFTLLFPKNVVHLDDIRSTIQSLKNFDFSIYFLNFNRFQNFNNALLAVVGIDTLIHF